MRTPLKRAPRLPNDNYLLQYAPNDYNHYYQNLDEGAPDNSQQSSSNGSPY